MIAVQGNIDLLAAWSSEFNLCTMSWVIGAGLAAIARNDIGNAIGQNKPDVAKKYCRFALVLCYIYSFFMGTIYMIFAYKITLLYSKIPAVTTLLWPMIFIGGIRAYSSAATPAIASMVRIVGKANTYTKITFFYQMICLDITCGVGLLYYDMSGIFLNICVAISACLVNLNCIFLILRYDWMQLKKMDNCN